MESAQRKTNARAKWNARRGRRIGKGVENCKGGRGKVIPAGPVKYSYESLLRETELLRWWSRAMADRFISRHVTRVIFEYCPDLFVVLTGQRVAMPPSTIRLPSRDHKYSRRRRQRPRSGKETAERRVPRRASHRGNRICVREKFDCRCHRGGCLVDDDPPTGLALQAAPSRNVSCPRVTCAFRAPRRLPTRVNLIFTLVNSRLFRLRGRFLHLSLDASRAACIILHKRNSSVQQLGHAVDEFDRANPFCDSHQQSRCEIGNAFTVQRRS